MEGKDDSSTDISVCDVRIAESPAFLLLSVPYGLPSLHYSMYILVIALPNQGSCLQVLFFFLKFQET